MQMAFAIKKMLYNYSLKIQKQTSLQDNRQNSINSTKHQTFLTTHLPELITLTKKEAFPKLMKYVGDPKSYPLISLLCVPYKILEWLIYAFGKPIIDSNLTYIKNNISFSQLNTSNTFPIEFKSSKFIF